MKNPLQEAPYPSSQTALQNFSQSSMGSLFPLLQLPAKSILNGQTTPPLSTAASLHSLSPAAGFSFSPKNIFQRSGKRPSSWPPGSSNCLQLFADSLDTCWPLIGLQKHYSDSMMANQGLTSGCLGSRHLTKQAAAKQAPHGVYNNVSFWPKNNTTYISCH